MIVVLLRRLFVGFASGGELREALRFLTRLPVGGRQAPGGAAAAMAAFPVVGLLLGALLLALDLLLAWAGLPGLSRDVLLVVALVALTGGLHLDGLMDSCDGLIGGQTPERRLLIMRDSRVGSYGVLGAASVLLLKVGLLGALSGPDRVAGLLLAPMLGRWSMVLGAALFPPARPDGMGAAFRAAMTPARLIRALTTCLLAAFGLGSGGVTALVACCLGTWLLGRGITRLIPGLTGDCYGALCELNEALALLVLAIGAG